MTGFGPISGIKALDSASVDAFSRWRTSNPTALFDTQLQYDDQPVFWETVLFGAGSTLLLSDESSLELICGTDNGDRVIRQTYRYFRYLPGKSQLLMITGALGISKVNVAKRVGYYDGYNGAFFELNEEINVALRSSVSGIPVDTIIAQKDWNCDKLDGTGPSSKILNISKTQIFVIDLQWLGSGRVRYGFMIDGAINYCHEIINANSIDSAYMTTANLPIRYEIENTGTVASSTSMKQICCTLSSEGGILEDFGIDRSVDNGTAGQAITTRASVLSIRPKDFINGVKNRGNIIPLDFRIYSETNSVFYEIVFRGTVNGASWVSVNDNSITEKSTTKNTVSGGFVVASGYVASAGPGSNAVGLGAAGVRFQFSLGSNFEGTAQDEFSIVCTSLTGTATVYASIAFKERF